MASEKDLIVAYVLNSLIHHDLEEIPLPWRKGTDLELLATAGTINLTVRPPRGETTDFTIAIKRGSENPIRFTKEYVLRASELV